MDLLRIVWMGTLLIAGWAPIALAATPTANATSTPSASGPSSSADCDKRGETGSGTTDPSPTTTRTRAPEVEVGVYVNKMHGVSFKDSKFVLDFYIWFRWDPVGPLAKYDPLATMELINGINQKSTGTVKKKETDMPDRRSYAATRITATILHNWKLAAFPFDKHVVEVHVEDSQFDACALKYTPDGKNSGPNIRESPKGTSTPDDKDSERKKTAHELELPGWKFTKVDIKASPKTYHTNFGDTSVGVARERGSESIYSRLTFKITMEREGDGPAIKLLAPAIIATLVAWVAFGIRPTDVDPRFGLGIGALFAAAASGLVVASYVPDSDVLTIADKVYIVAMVCIGASLVQSVYCLKWCESGKAKWKVLNLWSIILFPLLFAAAVIIWIASPWP